MSSKKLPPKNDPERTATEQGALKTAEKATQVAEALKEGKLPTTEQILTTIESIQDTDIIHESGRRMSSLGKKVLADTEKFLDSTKNLFAEKNAGDELQNTIYYGNKAAREMSDTTTMIPEDLKQRADEHIAASEPSVKELWRKTLLLLISNPEFRKLLNDINCIIQEALLATVHDQEGDVEMQTGEEKSPGEFTQDVAQQTRESVYHMAKAGADIITPKVKEFGEGKKSLQEAAGEGMKSLATAAKSRVAGYNLSPEKRDKIVTRFKNLMIETQKCTEYQEALTDLVDVMSRLFEYTQEAVTHVTETTESASQSSSLKIAQQNAKDLIENFANHKSLDDLICALKNLGAQIKHDEELHTYLKELQNFVLPSLRDPEFIQRTDFNEHGSRLIENGRRILLENYEEITLKIADEAAAFNECLQEDRTTLRWTSDLECLVKDIFLDEKGNPTIKFELIKDFGKILSMVTEKLKFIPLPRLENSDDMYDYCFDNVVIHVPDIVPKHIHMSLTSDINLDREPNNVVQNTAFFEISKLRADARNIAFYYWKKGGLITMRDVGLVDFAIPTDGLQYHMKICLELPSENTQFAQFHILEADTNITELKIRLHDTKHDFLYMLLTPLVEKHLKRQVENAITEYMKKAITFIQETICRVQAQVGEMQQATTAARQIASPVDEEKLKAREAWKSEAFSPEEHALKSSVVLEESQEFGTEKSIAVV
ncbi:18858_t:CDS:2 [Racocetra persica]|uniref:18858_t:CDS:1 n=1 Tax=Racocetra persica TaxID=160502 RepID=A0ACA9K834_9GLOM|nr:18858_t:CDS:2 [Racocetra persica]